jgi:hypothetical protein
MPRNLTILLALPTRPLRIPRMVQGAWVIFAILAISVALLSFLIWWREKIIEPDNER